MRMIPLNEEIRMYEELDTEEFDVVSDDVELTVTPVCNTVNCSLAPARAGLCDAHYDSRRGDSNG